jgi:biopolymer transport protein ExbD
MAGGTREDDDLLVGINVTPLVDVVLVLLVILMVTASYVASRAIPVDLPRAATGEQTSGQLGITIDPRGQVFLDGLVVDEAGLRRGARAALAEHSDVRAIIAADGGARHADVVRVVDVLRQEKVVRFALDVELLEPPR